MMKKTVAIRIVVLNFVEHFPCSRLYTESSQQPYKVGISTPILQMRNLGPEEVQSMS